MILSGVQFLLLLYLFISDLADQSVPLFELDKNHVLSLLKQSESGVCPFVISPSFLLEDAEATIVPDYSEDRFRKLSFVDNGLNFSFVHGKLRRYIVENFGESFDKFGQKIVEQLSFSHFFEVIFKPASIEMNKMALMQLWVLYVFVLVSVYSLWNYKERLHNELARHRLLVSTFGRTRFLIVVYAVGRASNYYQTENSVDAHDTALFFIWSVTIGLNYCMMTLFHEWLLHYSNRESFNYRVFRAAYVIFLIGVAVFATTLLSYIVLPRSRFIEQIYSVMLVADALRLVMSSLAEILRTLTVDDSNNEICRFGIVILSCSADLFESIFIGSAIYHGLFVRRRLVSIALCSYNCHIINRFITFDYPEFQNSTNSSRN